MSAPRSLVRRLGTGLFRLRGLTPVPFLLLALIGSRLDRSLAIGGGFAVAVGLLLRFQSVRHAGAAARASAIGASELVITGPYAIVRNPIYIANLLIYSGMATASGAWIPWLPLAVLLFFSFQYAAIVRAEEHVLLQLFGDEYRAYASAVARFVPAGRGPFASRRPLSLRQALRIERSTLAVITLVCLLLALRFWRS